MHRTSPLLVCLAVLVGMESCTRKTEGGLLLVLTVDPAVRGECLVIDGLDNGARVSRSTIARDLKKTSYNIGIARADFPAKLTWQASSMAGRCPDESSWKLMSRSADSVQEFPASGVTRFEVTLGQPDAALDRDRDTYVDLQLGGTDCDDSSAQTNPGASQVCASAVDNDCNGKLFCDDPGCASNTACTAQANSLAFETMLPTLQAGDCSGEVALLSMSTGRPAVVGEDTSVTLTPMGPPATNFQLFRDSSCTTLAADKVVPIRFGTARAIFSFKTPSAGMLTLAAGAPKLGTTQLVTTVVDRPVARLALNPRQLTARAASCSRPIDVIAHDAQGQPTNTSGVALTVTFLPPGTTSVQTFTDAACSIVGTPSIGSGTSRTQFYVKGSTATGASPITIQVSSPTVNNGMPATAELTIAAGGADHLVFTSPVLGISNNTCGTVPLELQLRDASGNVATAPTNGLNVTLSVVAPPGGGSLSFFTTPACQGSPVSSISFGPGLSTAQAFVRASGPGSYDVTASASALPVATATAQVSVSTVDPTALVFPSPTLAVQSGAGACSPGVRVQTRESNSLMAAVSPVATDVMLTIRTSPAGAATMYRDSNCTMPLSNPAVATLPRGSSELMFYFRDTVARSFTLSVSEAGGSGLSTTSPVQDARIIPGPTTRLVLSPTLMTAVAGTCGDQVVMRSTDSFDNPTSATGQVTLTSNPPLAAPAGVAFSQASDCSSASGTAALVDGGAFFYATAQRAQTYSLGATTGGAGSTTPVAFTVTSAAEARLAVVTQPSAQLSAGTCSTVVLERRDAFLNPAVGPFETINVNVDTAGVLSVHGDVASCMADTAGPTIAFASGQARASLVVRGRRAGASTLTASSAAGGSITTNGVTVVPGTTTRLVFNPPVSSTSTVGVCSTVAVERLDSEGNLSTLPTAFSANVSTSGATAGLILNAAMACSTQGTSTTLAFGASSTARFSYDPRAVGTLNFSATASGVTGTSASTNVGVGALARVRFVSPPTAGSYGGCLALLLEAVDVGNNRVNTPTLVNLSSSAMGSFSLSGSCASGPTTTASIPANGTLTIGYLPQALGPTTVTAAPSTGAAGAAAFTISAGVETSLTRSGAFGATTPAGTCVAFTATRVDSGGNPTGGGPRTVIAGLSGSGSLAPFEAQLFDGTSCNGSASSNTRSFNLGAGVQSIQFSVRVRKAGAVTLAISSGGLGSPADTSTTVTAGPLSNLVFLTTPPASLVVGSCSPVITVTGNDGWGNGVALGTQGLSMAGATFSTVSNCSDTITHLTAGTASTVSFFLSNSTAGSPTLRVGTSPSVSQVWNVVVPVATRLRWTPGASPPSSLARFTCSGAVRVQSTDAADVPTSTPTLRTLNFALSPSANLRLFSDAACSVPLSPSFGIGAGSSETSDFYVGAFISGSISMTASDASPMPLSPTATVSVQVTGGGTPSLVVTPASTELRFRSCTSVVVQREANTGPVTFGTTTVSVTAAPSSTAPSDSYSLHLANDCSDVGQSSLGGVTIAAGSASATVYLRGRSAEPPGSSLLNSASTVAAVTLTAADASGVFASANSPAINVHPAVRRGSCSLNEGSTSVSCPVQPPLPAGTRSSAFLTYQTAAPSLTGPTNSTVLCFLDSTGVNIDCARLGNNSTIPIRWQLVSMGRGLQVTTFNGSVSGAMGDQTVDITAAGLASRGEAFLLFAFRSQGINFDGNDMPTAEITTTTAATLKMAQTFAPNAFYSLQIVKMAGVSALGGEILGPTGASFAVNPPAPAGGSSQALLYTARIDAMPAESDICHTRLRGVVTDTAVTFTRSCGTPAFAGVVWERLSVSNSLASLQAFPSVSFTGLQSSTNAIGGPTLALDRVWSFIGGQGPGGQSGGESSSSAPHLGLSQAILEYDRTGGSTNFTLSRGEAGSGQSSAFSVFVINFTQ